jgi:putative zinc finger/helix-turn-helix YgiT family protein
MKIIDRIMKTCLICMNEHEILIVRVHESTVFKGIAVEYDAVYEYCDDYNEFNSTEEMISLNDIAVKNAYRKAVGLLTSDEIKAIRSKYGISQFDLSTLLGWGAKTITRYEGHQVQDFAHDTILRKIDSDPQWFLILLETNKNKFLEATYQKYFSTALKLFGESYDLYRQIAVKARRAWFKSNKGYSGMKRKCARFRIIGQRPLNKQQI